MSYVTHLEAAIDGTRLAARTLQTLHEGRPLWTRYDVEAVRRAVTREQIALRPPSLWRYRELLPVERDENVVSLGEGMTPLLQCPRLGAAQGVAGCATGQTSSTTVAATQAAGDQPTKRYDMKKSINLWALPYPDKMSLDRCLQLCADAGFDGVELNYALEGDLSPEASDDDIRKIGDRVRGLFVQVSSV